LLRSCSLKEAEMAAAEEVMVEMLQKGWGCYESLEELNDHLGRTAVLQLFDDFLTIYDQDEQTMQQPQVAETELCCV
jgi:hypothetical protein